MATLFAEACGRSAINTSSQKLEEHKESVKVKRIRVYGVYVSELASGVSRTPLYLVGRNAGKVLNALDIQFAETVDGTSIASSATAQPFGGTWQVWKSLNFSYYLAPSLVHRVLDIYVEARHVSYVRTALMRAGVRFSDPVSEDWDWQIDLMALEEQKLQYEASNALQMVAA